MKRYAMLLLLGIAPVYAQVTGQFASAPVPRPVAIPKLRIPLSTFVELERAFDSRIFSLGGPSDPVEMLGATRGLYLEGYGAVFTTELSLVIAPAITPFRPVISPELKAEVHKKKTDRLPKLKQAMREFLRTAAMKLQIPDDQQVVVAVRLDYVKWEDTLGLPGLVTVKATRGAAATDNFQLEEQ